MSENENQQTPWNGETYDSDKAWKLVVNLREERDKLKAKLSERDTTIADQTKTISELQPLSDKVTKLSADLDSAVKSRDELERIRQKEQLLEAAGLPRNYTQFVIGSDEDEWRQSVNQLSDFRGTGQLPKEPDPVDPGQNATGQPANTAEQIMNQMMGS